MSNHQCRGFDAPGVSEASARQRLKSVLGSRFGVGSSVLGISVCEFEEPFIQGNSELKVRGELWLEHCGELWRM